MSRSAKAHLLLVFVTLVWGSTFVVIKNALTDISPLLFNAVRMTLAAIVLVIFYRRDLRHLSSGALRIGIVVGLFLWAGYEFQTTGLYFTTPSKSAFLTGVSVVLVPVFLGIFWRRRIGGWVIAGVVAAFLGLYLLTVPAAEGASLFHLAGVNRGDVLTLGCAVVFAFHIIFLGRATQKYPFEQIATLQTAVSAALMLLFFPVVEQARLVWSPPVIWAILVTGLLGTAVAFTIQAWAQQFTPPAHTALIFALEPVFAWITSYIVLGERLGMRATVGAVLILAGVLLSEMKSDPRELRQELGTEPKVPNAATR
jgi:drug/metabolite transporter (DMT)-like permease